ncbi:DNA breaking-rejoining protein [Comamonas guangdongensis]|uniref:DNA breaking-rejoining protein n=1 Tax=Comamonas guangdongensis TaxID=510515 RepID=A0ABV3ZTV8_9BURK
MKRLHPMLAAALLYGSLIGGIAMAQSSSSSQSSASSVNGSSSYSGQITGNGITQYGLDTRPQQQLTVKLNTDNANTRMDVVKDGSADPLCQAATAPNICSFRTEPGASYRVQVYLTREAAQRGESARFTLTVEQGS